MLRHVAAKTMQITAPRAALRATGFGAEQAMGHW